MFTRLRHHGPRIRELLDAFSEQLAALNRSPATISHYRTLISHLADRLGDVPVRSIRADVLRQALLAVKGTPHRRRGGAVSDRYVEHHRKAWRRFFAWCVATGHLSSSPATTLGPWRVDEREPRTITPGNVASLIAACPKTFEGERDRALIAFLFGTGVRRRELVEISLEDLDLERDVVHVRGKTRRWRKVPIGPRLAQVLEHYLRHVRPRVLLGDSGRLFTDAAARELRPNAINQLLIKRRRAARVRAWVSPHVFRHTFATEYLRNGGERSALKRILGHRSEAMLDRYVHLVDVDIVRDHRRASPFERLGVAG